MLDPGKLKGRNRIGAGTCLRSTYRINDRVERTVINFAHSTGRTCHRRNFRCRTGDVMTRAVGICAVAQTSSPVALNVDSGWRPRRRLLGQLELRQAPRLLQIPQLDRRVQRRAQRHAVAQALWWSPIVISLANLQRQLFLQLGFHCYHCFCHSVVCRVHVPIFCQRCCFGIASQCHPICLNASSNPRQLLTHIKQQCCSAWCCKTNST